MNLVDRILGAGAPDAPALLTLDATWSHGELKDAVERAAAGLLADGVSPGDRVGVIADSSWFSVVGYLSALRAGAAAVPLPPTTSPEHARDIVRSTGMRTAFIATRAARLATALAGIERAIWDREGRSLEDASNQTLDELLAAAAAPPAWPTVDETHDLAVLLYTSGSTSRPRGVMLTHRNLLANTESILGYLELTATDRVMAVLPFHYSFGASLLHTHLAAGASIVVDPRFMYPSMVLDRMQETACTGFAGVPSHYQLLLRRSPFADMEFPHLRWLQQAGGKLADPFLRELRELLPAVRLFVMYGATEATARLSYLPPEELDARLGSIGRGIPGVTLHVLDETGAPVAPGEVGEIVAEGDNIALGYLDDPEETAATFRDGRLHTGDFARVDDDGFLFVVGRGKEFIKAGGSRVSCRQIEEALIAFPDVVEAAVVGVADELLGEAVAAAVVARDPDDETFPERLAAHAKAALAPMLRPKYLKVLAELPKNDRGKLQRQAVTALFVDGL